MVGGVRALVVFGALMAALVVVAAGEATGQESTFQVTNVDDSGAGSYRAAIAAASATDDGPDVINFDLGLEIVLDDEVEYTGTSALTLNGNGSTIDGAELHSILIAMDAPSVTVDDLTLTRGGAQIVDAAIGGGAIRATGAVTVTDSTLSENIGGAQSRGGAIATTGTVDLVDTALVDNYADFEGGAVYSVGAVTITGSTATGNSASLGGAIASLGPVSVTRSTVSQNAAAIVFTGGSGAGIIGNPVTVVDSTLAGNQAQGAGAAIRSPGSVTVTNSTLTGNAITIDDAVPEGAAISSNATVTLRHVTLIGNTEADGAQVVAHDLTAFGTVFAEPLGTGGSENCAVGISTTSEGENHSTDASCGLAGAGDTQNGGDPVLGALGDNGGPTETRAPGNGSPLVDAIPAADCHPVIDTDQRGGVRPFDGDGDDVADCDIGAVELQDTITPGFPPHGFADVAPTLWYSNGLDWAAHHEIVTGFPGNLYKPKDPVNRGQIASMLWTMLDTPPSAPPHGFADVAPTLWYSNALDWAKDQGLVTGFPGNLYKPKDPVNRGQIVSMLWNLVGRPDGAPPHDFADVTPTLWYSNALDWAKDQGLVTGFPGNLYKPKDPVNRGQIAAMLFNLAANADAWVDYPDTPPSTVTFA